MSWIQSFFQSFKKNDEDYEEIDIHNETQESNPKENMPKETHEHSKKGEARVAYQYPKGKFRFPLIPDEQASRERVRQKRSKEKVPPKLEENQTDVELQQEPKPKPKPKKETITEKKIQPKGKSVRPFQPTQIPSPIFGFERPKKVDIVEYDMSSFSFNPHNDVDNQSEQVKPEEVQIPTVREFFDETSIVKVPTKDVTVVEETSTEDMKTVSSALVIGTVKEVASMAKEVNGEFDVESQSLETEIAKEPSTIELPTIEMDAVEETLTEEIQSVSSELVIETTQEVPSLNVEPIKTSPAVIDRTEDSQAGHGNDENSSTERESTAHERRHLPFNVMMLKQDKRKLEQKSIAMEKREENTLGLEIKTEMETAVNLDSRMNHLQQSSTLSESNETNSLENGNEATVQEVQVRRAECEVEQPPAYYVLPDTSLLNPPVLEKADSEWLSVQEFQLNETLQNFNVGAKVVHVTQGPSVTRFEVQPEPGVKVNKITNLSDDIKLSLAARDIRIEAPIPGKHTIGIEVPNQVSRPVMISEIIHTSIFKDQTSPLTAVLGLDISGTPIVTDLKKMPHGLIAGATGSGKSVCINSILVSLLFKASPDELKLLLIDPKMVELAPYNRIPHLVSPVITDVKAATAALKWAVDEMERRYELFAHTGVRDINRFNELAVTHQRYSEKLPYIVIVIDELADLMMMSPADVEEAICRIAQKARACGIHLIVATQRPSVDVITGLIKANIPTRVAFSVSSQIDSRTIIDISGAEKLLGRGDMLFLENGSSKAVRLQGTFVTDEEIDRVVAHVRREREPEYLFEQEELLKKAQVTDEEDELFYEACEFVVDQGGASTSSLQRRFKVGYNRAARLIDLMEQHGFISGAKGSKPRDVLISEADLGTIQETSTINH